MASRPPGIRGNRSKRSRGSGARSGSSRASPARRIAHRILLRVSEEGAWASRLLEALDSESLDPRDIALVHEMVLGVLRWRGRLDERIGRACRRPLEKLDPTVREALRLGAYQLMFLDRVPSHAAVDESVALARSTPLPGRKGEGVRAAAAGRAAAGLVNAVLRRIAREGAGAGTKGGAALGPATHVVTESATIGQPGRPPGPAGAPAVARRGLAARLASDLSHPRWMVERALARFGEEEARAWLAANNQPPPLTLRPNPLYPHSEDLASRLLAAGVRTVPAPIAPGALTVLEGRPARTALFAEGAFWIQDEASQIVPLLFPPPWTGISADLCAAPGGKTFVMATASEEAMVAAFDLRPHRLARMQEGALRIAPGRIALVVADMAGAPPVRPCVFDRVLVDAPCSGTGVLRRHPEIRWRLEPGRLSELAALQSRLLDTAVAMLRPGGCLVYSVCSIEPEEGDRVFDSFLDRPGLLAIDPRDHLPETVRSLVGSDGRLRTYAHRHGCDAFFAAAARKT